VRLFLMMIASAALALPDVAYAQAGPFSGHVLLPGCRAFVNESQPTLEDAVQRGVCAGFVSAALSYWNVFDEAHRFCPPTGVSLSEAMTVVIRVLEARPDLMQRDLRFLVPVFMREAWPCPK
jgi:hypothetical protein